MKKKLIEILTLVLLFLLLTNYARTEIKIIIKFQIENEILTNLDFLNEEKYLLALNNNLQNIPKNQLKQLSKNSLIREKIKEIELLKNYKNLDIDETYFDQLINNYSKRVGFSSVKEFTESIENNGLEVEAVKKKIKVEVYWNQLIVKKFLKDVKIDKEKIEEDLKKNLTQTELLLSEIVFNIDKKSDLKNKFELIKQDIATKGFSNAALIHGVSDSSNNGGKLGWIKLSSLNSKIKNQITKIDVGKFSNPIVVPGGFLILKIEDQREVKKNLDLNKEIQLTVNEKTNEQLNKLSIVYFNKVKKDIEINAF